MSILTAEKVTAIFMDCLFKDGEDTTGYVFVHGIMMKVGFHPARLESHRKEVLPMLLELPISFQKEHGGGMSFLSACDDKHGNQWTGMQQTMEQLLLLGMALGVVKYCMPRELWGVLPGGMPYYVITIPQEK